MGPAAAVATAAALFLLAGKVAREPTVGGGPTSITPALTACSQIFVLVELFPDTLRLAPVESDR